MIDPAMHLEVLRRAHRHAAAHLAGMETSPVGAAATAASLRDALGSPFPEKGLPASVVLDRLAEAVRPGLVHSSSPRFFGWVMGGTLPAALGADWLTSAWDQNAAVFATSPAAAIVEEIVGQWLRFLFDLPDEASFALTTGCQLAHVTCLAVARHALLAARGWDVETHGLAGAPPVRLLTGASAHGSIVRAVRLLGLGAGSIEYLAEDEAGRLRGSVLEAALKGEDRPALVLLKAGDLYRGSCDAFQELAPVARAAGAWTHVDGAFGLFLKASAKHRSRVEGVELCDSWATDGHKWLNTPFDCGYAFVRDAAAHRAAISHSTAYVEDAPDARDQMAFTPEWSRRARGFSSWAALRELGREGLADVIDRGCAMALRLTEGLAALPGGQLVWRPTINQGLVRFLSAAPGATEEDHDRHTQAVIRAVNATGDAFFTGGIWRGRQVMRISVVNHAVGDDDVDRALAAADAAVRRLRGSAA